MARGMKSPRGGLINNLSARGGRNVTKSETCITGVGAATPLGHTYQTIAANLLAGKSGVRKVTSFPVDQHPSQIAGTVETIPCPVGLDPEAFQRLPSVDRLTLWCCASALQDAGWWDRRSEIRIGLVLGTAGEWTSIWEKDYLQEGGKRFYQPQEHLESSVQRTRKTLGLRGPAMSLSAACASGNYALELGRCWLQKGWCDLCIAGGCDMVITPMTLAGFGNLRALSRRNNDPAAASRPFDADRDGFVIGEGGTVFVLETEASARNRSARRYAKMAGFGASSDAYNMVIPCPDPQPAIAAVRQALHDAQLNPEQIHYVNAHATATPVGDVAESKTLTTVFGHNIKRLPVSSTKSMTGHLLTAAAAFEALVCIIAMDHQAVPPTINLDQLDPDCQPLLHVANQAQERKVTAALSNSFGFGGSNTALILKAA